jgi:hypothetical protein
MNPIFLEYVKIAALIFIGWSLEQILRYVKLIWNDICDIHRAVVQQGSSQKRGGRD